VSALRGHIEGSSPKREYKIDTRLVVRESTGFPRGTMAHLRGGKDTTAQATSH